ncbi:MAG: septal ring lytic transglycosylase RlpA family protein [Candidatus Kapabacteria bacterium]|nr:septal ring lytic transglycosylase RlpA family protein [Candidatus Kapabacteria bacterium]
MKNILKLLIYSVLAIFFVSCGSTKNTKEKIFDKTNQEWNNNTQDDIPFEVGIASYYSSVFEGKATASGEIYSGSELTAAHKTLPFGTIVKVRNLKNNKSVVVRINDRGPSKTERVIDLSYRAAEILDMIRDGIVKVEIIIIKK